MKKIGLVGGIGPASTVEYYRELVQMCINTPEICGYPEIVIDSVDMSKHDKVIAGKDYEALAKYVLESLNHLKAAGAELAAITANTEHIIWDKIVNALPLKTISVVDAVIEELDEKEYKRILVLGTEWTMASGLFDKAISDAGRTPILPTPEDQKRIGALIYPNLENGVILLEDKHKMIQMIEKYCAKENADAVLLGCTELPLMIKEEDVKVPIVNSAKIHIQKIFNEASAQG